VNRVLLALTAALSIAPVDAMASADDPSHFSWFKLIPGVGEEGFLGLTGDAAKEAYIFPSAMAVCVLLIVLALIARRGLDRARKQGGTLQYVPASNLGVRNLAELYVSLVWGMVRDLLGTKDGRTHFPLVATLFIYIWFSNLLAVTPGFLPPSDNVSNNVGMALVVFVVFNVSGIWRNGLGYFKHMAGPILVLAPLIFTLEMVALIVRPASLTLRLAGNMYGDHMVFGIMSDLVPVVIPSIFLGLGIFVSSVQAFVFTLLSIIYIALAVAHDEH
jgi:F-type H+-transporting ATPase subunit a